jgi:hypothetical protein
MRGFDIGGIALGFRAATMICGCIEREGATGRMPIGGDDCWLARGGIITRGWAGAGCDIG